MFPVEVMCTYYNSQIPYNNCFENEIKLVFQMICGSWEKVNIEPRTLSVKKIEVELTSKGISGQVFYIFSNPLVLCTVSTLGTPAQNTSEIY